ncbi:MAG: hypothetical protein KDB71_13515 [Mycobacterium sp.]|nr:hypothetical protein [Mycobacterium sp.]
MPRCGTGDKDIHVRNDHRRTAAARALNRAGSAGAALLTRDHRAVRTYELLKVTYELVN